VTEGGTRRRHPLILTWLKDYWHIGAGLLFIILAVGETRWQVGELIKNEAAEARQWQLIRENIVKIESHEIEIEGMKLHMTPEAIQRWGQIQATVAEDHRDLVQHLRNHPRSE
jgi:hypothetical protein